jgi:hypothetical protein
MKVECEVEETELQGAYRDDIPGVCVKCSRCGHDVTSFGTDEASIRRCLASLREQCPNGESNFYEAQ